jgi:hypothetical protein
LNHQDFEVEWEENLFEEKKKIIVLFALSHKTLSELFAQEGEYLISRGREQQFLADNSSFWDKPFSNSEESCIAS